MSNTETIEFSALGTRLRLAAGNNPEMVREVAQLVQDGLTEVTEVYPPNTEYVKLALLTALNIAEQLFKERELGHAEYKEAVGRVRVLLESLG